MLVVSGCMGDVSTVCECLGVVSGARGCCECSVSVCALTTPIALIAPTHITHSDHALTNITNSNHSFTHHSLSHARAHHEHKNKIHTMSTLCNEHGIRTNTTRARARNEHDTTCARSRHEHNKTCTTSTNTNLDTKRHLHTCTTQAPDNHDHSISATRGRSVHEDDTIERIMGAAQSRSRHEHATITSITCARHKTKKGGENK